MPASHPDLSTKYLLTAAERVLLLRRYLDLKDYASVDFVLRWLETNSHLLPEYVKTETAESRVRHDNEVMIQTLLEALKSGGVGGTMGGWVGALNFRAIQVTYNCTRTCHNLTRTCHNLTRTWRNLTRTCHNLTRTCFPRLTSSSRVLQEPANSAYDPRS